jgi:hypothetical protein
VVPFEIVMHVSSEDVEVEVLVLSMVLTLKKSTNTVTWPPERHHSSD